MIKNVLARIADFLRKLPSRDAAGGVSRRTI
jgi:hypothetical protein